MSSRRLSYRLLRVVRIAVSVAVFGILTGCLTAFGMQVPAIASFLGNVQLIPAAAAFSLAVFVGWLVVTLLAGRVYCSTVCPLGTLQDISARVRRRRTSDGLLARNELLRYRFSPSRNRLGWITLGVVLVCLMTGYMLIPSLLDPYTAYVRFCLTILRPLWCIVTPEALHASFTPDYPPLLIAVSSIGGALAALLVTGGSMTAAWIRGRPVCNTVCPIGVVLGSVSRYAVFQFDIDTDLCTNCRRCEEVCKCHCINLNDHVVDSSRCVVCFDCTDACRDKAIAFKATRKQLSIPMMQTTLPQTSSTLSQTSSCNQCGINGASDSLTPADSSPATSFDKIS